jgi:aspartate dehydrogenase
MNTTKDLTVGIAGLGAAGKDVARRLIAGIPGLRLAAVGVRDEARARAALPDFDGAIMAPGDLCTICDVVVECLPPGMFRAIGEPTLRAGRIFMPLSVGQLLVHWDLVDLAQQHGGRIIVPTGALLGLDAVRAAAEGEITAVTMVTRKPPGGLAGAPHLIKMGIDLDGITEPLCVYRGSVREGALGFPANLNVAAALSLAGIGPDRTELQVWADPGVTRNTHTITLESDSARLSMTIENIPSTENLRTGRITALSVVAALRGLVSPLRIGS